MKAMTIMNNEKNGASEPTEEVLFYIVCPCNCGRAAPFTCASYPGDISKLAKQVWQRIAGEEGLEGAIEFLHEMVNEG
jgi:hypothetical protein